MYLLYAKNISKSYRTSRGEHRALRRCTIPFPAHGLIAIEGKSGSGKSTLLNVLLGIEKPSTGRVYFQGGPASKPGAPLVAAHASMVFQHYNLIDGLSALDNVALPGKMRHIPRSKAKGLLERFGLDAVRDKDVKVLSGGEKQRVAICRALMNDPAIVFADEPTGALDEKNSLLVMDTLKEVSKSRLVVLVSHNHPLVERYADAVIHIADGKVSGKLQRIPLERRKQKRTRHSSSWLGTFFLRNMKRNLFKDTMCFLSGVVGFLSLLMSFGYLQGNMPAMEKEQTKTLHCLNARLSRRSVVDLPGSTLTLVKKTTPSEDETMDVLEGVGECTLSDNYEYFFPSVMPFSFEGEAEEPCLFCPLLDITLEKHGRNLVTWGEPPEGINFDECVVNEEFVAKYGVRTRGGGIEVSQRSVVTYEGKQNEIFVEGHFTVKAVVRELSFLNVPRVYYSSPMLGRRLASIDVSNENGDSVDLRELVANAEPDSAYGSYSRLVFLRDPSCLPALFERIQRMGDGEYELTSEAYSLWQSYASLSKAFSSSLGLFVGLAFVGLALILGMASYSSFVLAKKESALLTVLGAKGGEILSIFVFEAMVLCAGSMLLSFGLSPLLQRFLNEILRQKFDIPGLIAIPYREFLGVPFLVFFALLLFSLMLGFLSSIIPVAINRHIPLAEELRDE